MPRLRTIRPTFPQTPAMGRVGREARLLFILLWTAADDAGRLRLIPEQLAEQLFPFDPDAPMLLPAWLDELERERCIERYSIEGADYLRILHWRRLQKIQHPSRSRFPAAPHESHEIHEESDERQQRRGSEANPHEDAFFDGDPASVDEVPAFTPGRVRGYLDLALRKALDSDVHTAPARYIELMGRDAGMWSGKGAPVGRKEPDDSVGPSPHEIHGLPDTRAGD